MKKILAIAPYAYLPYYSGGQKFIALFLEHLSEVADVTVISVPSNQWPDSLPYRRLPWLKPGRSRFFDLSLVNRIAREIREQGYDTLLIEHPYFHWLAARLKKKTGIRVVLHTHNIEYQRFRSLGKWWWPVLKWYERRAFRAADKLLFITPEDRRFATEQWGIPEHKCYDLPFGVTEKSPPRDRDACRQALATRHGLSPDEAILLFNGWLSYGANLDALKVILDEVNPLLLARSPRPYRILICGKGLPGEMQNLQAYAGKRVTYAGFVDDIETYFKGADLFLNPVQSGGGIKTKMVEAVAYGTTVIATATGATGMDPALCGEKLVVVNDNDWKAFAAAIEGQLGRHPETPAAFYDHFSWERIIPRLLKDAI